MLSEKDLSALCTYLSQGFQQGHTKEELKKALMQEGGWPALDVDIACARLSQTTAPYGNATYSSPDNVGPSAQSTASAWHIKHAQAGPTPAESPMSTLGDGSPVTAGVLYSRTLSPQQGAQLSAQSMSNTYAEKPKGSMWPKVIAASTCITFILGGYVAYHYLSTSDSNLPQGVSVDQPSSYTFDDQHALVMPAIVRVFTHVKGTLKVAPFRIDIHDLTVVPLTAGQKSYEKEIDEQVTGTAFSISEDGVFATNAHVVSADLFRMSEGAVILFKILFAQYLEIAKQYGIDSKEAARYQQRIDEISKMDSSDPSVEALTKSLLAQITFRDTGGEVRLIPQGITIKSYADMEKVGFEADSVAVQHDWLLNGKDVALVTIKPTIDTLPALALSTSSKSVINQAVAVYGFPGATDMDFDSLSSVTVTQGRVTAFKTLPGSTIETLQTDAKVSKGSSGGPLVDAAGQVVGIITLESGSKDGDNFAFALPSRLIHELTRDNEHPELRTRYQTHIKTGLALKEHHRCVRANESFSAARDILKTSLVTRNEIDSYISACEESIQRGQSLDTKWDVLKEYLRTNFGTMWILIIAGSLFGILIIVTLFVLLKKLRQDQARIRALEQETTHS
ncbi:MAG: trypsin-like peptidase domain-containing protein [Candidatus Pacebacteria bacterium]|nr:trypsin-like peptidase domain-containing protein [Candidatus Paceibacterota bacterium]